MKIGPRVHTLGNSLTLRIRSRSCTTATSRAVRFNRKRDMEHVLLGKALGPWVQLNLGAERTILAIEIYGHRAEPKCDLNLLDESFWSPLCDGSNLEDAAPFNPTYSDRSYDDTEKQGAVIGVGPPGDGPCVDEKSNVDGSTGGNCAGYVCATITTMSELGFVGNEAGTVHKEQSDASVKVMWYASPFLRRGPHRPSPFSDRRLTPRFLSLIPSEHAATRLPVSTSTSTFRVRTENSSSARSGSRTSPLALAAPLDLPLTGIASCLETIMLQDRVSVRSRWRRGRRASPSVRPDTRRCMLSAARLVS